MTRLNSKIKAVWGVSEIGFSITATLETAFFIFFLTDVAQLPLAISGIIAGGASAVDTVAALFAGVFIDKIKLKRGKYRPWLLYAPLISIVFFTLCFTRVGGDISAGIVIGIGYILSHFCWNIAFTSVRSMTNVLTDDLSERAFLSGRLGSGAALGRVAASLLVPWMTAALAAVVSGVASYTLTAAIVSILYIVCYGIQYAATKGYDDEPNLSEGKSISFKEMGTTITHNRNLIFVFCHDLVRLIAYYTVAAGTAYYCRVVLGDPTLSAGLLMVFYLGCFIGSFVAGRVAKKIGTKTTTIVGIVGWMALWVLAYFLNPGYIALNVMLFFSQVFFGLAYGLTANLYSMCATWGHWKNNVNAVGVVMSFLTVSIKLGVTLRAVILPLFLGFVGYNAAATTFDAAAQTSIGQMYFLLPVALLAISLVFIFFFNIKDSDIPMMNEDISAREKTTSVAEI